MTEVDTSSLNFTEDEIKTAGLQPEGWYLFQIRSKRAEHIEGGVSQRTGKAYDSFDVIRVNFAGAERALYDDNGQFLKSETLPGFLWQDIGLSTSPYGLSTLKALYKAATGRNLGAGNVETTVEEILGAKVWGRIYHKQGDDGVVREQLDQRRFRSQSYGPPATVAVRSE